jgi:non-heme chloroperoxidase
MDTYASDVAVLADTLDLQRAVHIGHSKGGGEVPRYGARAKPCRVARTVLISAVPPIMLRSQHNTGGLPIDVFDVLRWLPTGLNSTEISLQVPSLVSTDPVPRYLKA